MSPYRGGARKQRKFRPTFDLLEDRALPSLIGGGISIEPIPMPPVQGQATGVVSVSTDHLKLVRGGDAASFEVALTGQPSAEVDVTLAQYERPFPDPSSNGVAM